MRKLSRPWHGPYRVVQVTKTGVMAQRVYNSKGDQIHVHLHRVTRCPPNFPAGYYWYGERRYGPGRPPKWIDRLIPVCEEPLPEAAGGTQGLPQVEPERALESESEVNPSADQPLVTSKDPQQPPRVRTRTRTVVPPAYFSY